MQRPNAYFAYGSNLHPLRLGLRTPSCRPLGPGRLDGHALRFHKRSDRDGSGKADACRTDAPGDAVQGVVYELAPEDFPVLDRHEGLGPGGYEVRVVTVSMSGGEREVFVYTALDSHIDSTVRPWRWYRDLVLRGAEWQGMPAAYVEAIRAVAVAEDPDQERHATNAALLRAMADWRPEHGYRLP